MPQHRSTEPDEDATPITGTFGAQKRVFTELAHVRRELERARKQRLLFAAVMIVWAVLYLYRWVAGAGGN